MASWQASSGSCNPVPDSPSFAVVDPFFNVAFQDSVASLKRICDYLGNCSTAVLNRIDEQLEQVSAVE